MGESPQDKEFKAFGITGRLRTGVIIGFLAISLSVNIWAIKALVKSSDDKYEIQKEATKQVIELLRPDINQMAQKVNASSVKIDSAVNGINTITENHKK